MTIVSMTEAAAAAIAALSISCGGSGSGRGGGGDAIATTALPRALLVLQLFCLPLRRSNFFLWLGLW